MTVWAPDFRYMDTVVLSLAGVSGTSRSSRSPTNSYIFQDSFQVHLSFDPPPHDVKKKKTS